MSAPMRQERHPLSWGLHVVKILRSAGSSVTIGIRYNVLQITRFTDCQTRVAPFGPLTSFTGNLGSHSLLGHERHSVGMYREIGSSHVPQGKETLRPPLHVLQPWWFIGFCDKSNQPIPASTTRDSGFKHKAAFVCKIHPRLYCNPLYKNDVVLFLVNWSSICIWIQEWIFKTEFVEDPKKNR